MSEQSELLRCSMARNVGDKEAPLALIAQPDNPIRVRTRLQSQTTLF